MGRLLLFWDKLWQGAGPDGERLLRAYAAPERAYHDLEHLEEVLDWSLGLPLAPERLRPLQIALFYHDAVYDPRRQDNEEASAALAQRELRQVGYDQIATVAELILATRHLQPPDPLPGGSATGDSPLQDWMVDVDLSILGAEPARFFRYHEDVRREYAWVPELLYRHQRAQVLRGFLNRARIYRTDYFHERLERQARQNLQAALQ